MSGLNILIVDDEPNIRKTLEYCLKNEGYAAVPVSNAEDAVREAGSAVFDAVLLDLHLGGDDGMRIIPRLIADSPWIKILVITAYATIETAVEAMRLGAFDYIPKPFSPDQIKIPLRRIAAIRRLEQENAVLKEDMGRNNPEAEFNTKNPVFQRVLDTAQKAARSEAVLLLRGESGTGKTVLARAIHQWSQRSGKPCSVISCPAIPSELLESELFGHKKGAFTGAVRDNRGRIAACEGGSLILDEIADLPLSLQAKMLRFIQDREYESLGDPLPHKADVRIIAATNAHLENLIAQGRFREDLYFRLNVIPIRIPPLRERPEDIVSLAENYLKFFSNANHKTIGGFTEEAAILLENHSWPGNLRELRNTIERAVILSSNALLSVADLPETIAPRQKDPNLGDPVSLAVIEELHIRKVLASSSSLQAAAEILGIDQATLWRRRKNYGV